MRYFLRIELPGGLLFTGQQFSYYWQGLEFIKMIHDAKNYIEGGDLNPFIRKEEIRSIQIREYAFNGDRQ